MKRQNVTLTSKLALLTSLLLSCFVSMALDSVVLDIHSIKSEHWQMQNIKIALGELMQTQQTLELKINTLMLPKPFDGLSLAAVRCTDFTWQNNSLICKKGHTQIHAPRWQSPEADFSFSIKNNSAKFELTHLQLAGGTVSLSAEELGTTWKLSVNASRLNSHALKKLLPPDIADFKDGNITVQLTATGSHDTVNRLTLRTETSGLAAQSPDGRFAGEALNLISTFSAKQLHGLWQWQLDAQVSNGSVYAEPVYLEIGEEPINIKATGVWDKENQQVEMTALNYAHGNSAHLSGNSMISYKSGFALEKAMLNISSNNLQHLSAIYLKSIFEQTLLEGISFGGHINADMILTKNSLTTLSAKTDGLDINDVQERLVLKGGKGIINWSADDTASKPSEFSWQQLKWHNLPIDAASLSFLSRAQSLRLLKPARLPLLGGAFTINQFGWLKVENKEPVVYFEGQLNDIPLEQLSSALNWAPLSGTLTGHIPRIDYAENKLNLSGELTADVFDGTIKVSKLAATDLFSARPPKFYCDIDIKNLDLDPLTKQFEFGGITGKLSGYVHKLTLENWQPVSFTAWFGTPDDDDSSHRISQKAVKNIANIGGGGTSDLLSRSFLRLFDTFGYDKIGLGCRLHNGICDLVGVEATETGYAIIKGGGLPRIDVIGYNPKLNWTVLMQRLKRITASDQAIIE